MPTILIKIDPEGFHAERPNGSVEAETSQICHEMALEINTSLGFLNFSKWDTTQNSISFGATIDIRLSISESIRRYRQIMPKWLTIDEVED